MVVTATMVGSAIAVLFGVFGLWSARWLSRRWSTWTLGVLSGVFVVMAATVLAWSIALASGDRSSRSLDLSPGVSYERIAFDEPRRQVLHIAVVDFDHPCVGLITTRPGEGGLVAAETATQFIDRTRAILSVNVAFFYPFDEYPYWASYPESGDLVTAIGPVVIDGQWLGNVDGGGRSGLAVTRGRLSAGAIPAEADFAVRGATLLVADGNNVAPETEAYPRTIVGVDRDDNRLLLVVSDGKQPGYADGSTFQEVADLLIERGVDEAIEFDGGGSATMAGIVDGQVELLSRPSHQRIPGRQRPVASHLGVTVDPDCP